MKRLGLKYSWLTFLLLWSTAVGISLFWNLRQFDHHAHQVARNQARFIFKMVESVRLWNARHGGVYARIVGDTLPNPYLEIPEREITTPSGHDLTLINPAYMTRQLTSVVKELSGVNVHLTSLKPINPKNGPDSWERAALEAFERGAGEQAGFVGEGDRAVYRFIAPLHVERECLKCHEKQGYKLGDVRGGVSVSFAAAPLLMPQTEQRGNMVAAHAAAWLLVSGFGLLVLRRIRRQMEALGEAKARQDELVEIRTAELKREVEERQNAEQRMKQLLDSSGEGVFGIDLEGRCTFCNPVALKLLGYTREELLGQPIYPLLLHSHADGTPREPGECRILETLRNGRPVHVEDDVFWRKDRKAIPVEYRSHPVHGGGRQIGAVVTFSNVTRRRQREARLRQLSSAVEFSPDPVVITDAAGKIEYVNLRFLATTGFSLDEVLGRTPAILKSGDTPASTYQQLWQTIASGKVWQGTFRNRRKNGELYWEEASIAPITDDSGVITHYVGVKKDITERRQLEERIWREANYDALTGLPNRRLFHDRLERALVAARRQGHHVALLFIDLDRFKEVNDSLGHEAGDELLKQAAQRLAECVRESDTVARMGGDEFTVILPGTTGAVAVLGVVHKLMARITEPFLIDGHPVTLSASIGAACFPEHGTAISELMRNADAAMYQAKAAGRNAFRFHQPPAEAG